MVPVLWMDDQIVVCCKPAGVLSQGDGSVESMETLLARSCGGTVYPVHRLDRNVGGVMVYAKSRQAAARLSAEIQQGQFQKEYLAVAEGVVPEQGRWTDLLFRDGRSGKAYVVKRPRKGVQEARLSFERLHTGTLRQREVSLCRVRLETGRFHQIRAQFSSHGFPLAGDGKYGGTLNCAMGLFSYRLRFLHPQTGEPVEFTARPPQELPWMCFQI